MQFFLYGIVARIVAIYLCFDCGRDVWHGFVERKIRPYSPDFVDWFNPWSNIVAHRDATPIRYWIIMGVHITIFCSCLVVAIWVVAPKHLSIADGPFWSRRAYELAYASQRETEYDRALRRATDA